MSLPDAQHALQQLTAQIKHAIDNKQLIDPVVVGIITGGLWVAEHIAQSISLTEPVGSIDIGFHRDDYHQRPDSPSNMRIVKPSYINHDLEGRQVILVDDVIHTGRTIRAAINHLFEYGRPRCVKLAVLISRNGRELPIEPDYCAATLDKDIQQNIKLTCCEPLDWQFSEPRDA